VHLLVSLRRLTQQAAFMKSVATASLHDDIETGDIQNAR